MTALEQKQADFATLSGAYMLLRDNTAASNSLLSELLEHVRDAHMDYRRELNKTVADALAGEEVTA